MIVFLRWALAAGLLLVPGLLRARVPDHLQLAEQSVLPRAFTAS